MQHNAVNAFRDALTESRLRIASKEAGASAPGITRWKSHSLPEDATSRTLFVETDSAAERPEDYQSLWRSADGALEYAQYEEHISGEDSRSELSAAESAASCGKEPGQQQSVGVSERNLEGALGDSAELSAEGDGTEKATGGRVFQNRYSMAIRGLVTDPETGGTGHEGPQAVEIVSEDFEFDSPRGKNASEALETDSKETLKPAEFEMQRGNSPSDPLGLDSSSEASPPESGQFDLPGAESPVLFIPPSVICSGNRPVGNNEPGKGPTEENLSHPDGQLSPRWAALGAKHEGDAERWLVAGRNEPVVKGDDIDPQRSLVGLFESVSSAEPGSESAAMTHRFGFQRSGKEELASVGPSREPSANLPFFDAVETFVTQELDVGAKEMTADVSSRRQSLNDFLADEALAGGNETSRISGNREAEKEGGKATAAAEWTAVDGGFSADQRNGSAVEAGDCAATESIVTEASGVTNHVDSAAEIGHPPARPVTQYVLHVKVEGKGGEIVGTLEGVEEGTTLEGVRGIIRERLGEKAPGTFGFLTLDVSSISSIFCRPHVGCETSSKHAPVNWSFRNLRPIEG